MGRLKWLVITLVYFTSVYPHPGSLHLNLSKQCGDLTCQENEYCRQFDHICKPCSVICNKGSNNFVQDTCESECQDYLHDERYVRIQNDYSEESGTLSDLYRSLQKDVLILKILVGISLVVISITIASFIAFVIYFWRFVHPSGSSDQKVKDKYSLDTDKKGSNKSTSGKPVELPTIYNNKYGISHSPEISPPRVRGNRNPTENEDGPRNHSSSTSPNKSETSMNSINTTNSTPGTMSTLVNTSNGSSALSQRFRREPSESTIPEYMAYDNPTISPISPGQIYTHHV